MRYQNNQWPICEFGLNPTAAPKFEAFHPKAKVSLICVFGFLNLTLDRWRQTAVVCPFLITIITSNNINSFILSYSAYFYWYSQFTLFLVICSGFVTIAPIAFWTQMFVKYFLHVDNPTHDDLLFYVKRNDGIEMKVCQVYKCIV